MSPHPFVHVEFSAKDLEAAGQFYSDLFGWQFHVDRQLNYATFETGEGFGGGLNPVSERYPAGSVVVYVDTDDIEASLAKVEALGGKTVTSKTEIQGFGWFGLFSDPSGNLVGLYTALPGTA